MMAFRTPPVPGEGTSSPLPTFTQSRVFAEPVLAIYGDSYTAGSGAESPSSAYPHVLAESLGARRGVHGAAGAGYVLPGTPSGHTYEDLVAQNSEPNADVQLVVSGRNDGEYGSAPTDVQAAAARTYAMLREAAPGAVLVVVGPIWDETNPPRNVYSVRDAIKAAAVEAGAVFVDPLAEEWLFDHPEYIGDDGKHPNNAGHAHLAQLIRPHVEAALARVPSLNGG
jgi:lysophospholipase L1-like esterase